MKLFIGCLIGSLFYAALADVKVNDENKTATTSDKISIAKPKRDASLLSSIYHGPSYKYLPPSTLSSVYDTYPGKVSSYAGYSGGHISKAEGVYTTGLRGHGHRYHGYPLTGNRNIAVYHSLDSEPTVHFGSGHHGLVFSPVHHSTATGSASFNRGGYKGATNFHTGAKLGPNDFAASRPHTFAFANGGNSIGSSAAAGNVGYHYTKGFGGSYAPVSTGFQSVDALSTSAGTTSHEERHEDHVHNGGAHEHVYVVSNIPAGLGNGYESKQTPIHQHPLPSAAGTSYNTKYYNPGTDQAPSYAAGHKGLGHFGFTSNKPQVLHAGIPGTSFQQPFYSKAPFKPSTFLGAKFEGATNGEAYSQPYLPPLEEAASSTGYDYPLPTETYQEPHHHHHHHQTVEVQTTSLHEPDSAAYLPTKNNPDSVYELSTDPNSNYLSPTDSYALPPYSH